MVGKALSESSKIILVDTTGFVSGEGGKELKRKKIDLLYPHFIIALQRSGELEAILEPYNENPLHQIFRLPVAEEVKTRSMEERRAYRATKFRSYFKEAETRSLALDGIQLEGNVVDSNGISIPLNQALHFKGLLAGLKNEREDTLSLGIIEDFIEDKMVKILTPLKNLEEAKFIQLGSLKLNPSYEDERF